MKSLVQLFGVYRKSISAALSGALSWAVYYYGHSQWVALAVIVLGAFHVAAVGNDPAPDKAPVEIPSYPARTDTSAS